MRMNGRSVKVSRFICELAHGEPPASGQHAAHSCGNGHLGCVNPRHLSWKTAGENQMDRVAHGTSNRGRNHPCSKLSESDVQSIRRLIGRMPLKHIAEKFGINVGSVHGIKTGKNWTWLKGLADDR
jgi:hypothetical protein